MNITTLHNNSYSYLRQTNEIVSGVVDDSLYAWTFMSPSEFSSMPEVYMFIIAITEQCNLRCTYCCYSGEYKGNHSHNSRTLCEGDIQAIYDFIDKTAKTKPIRISFYGGEPLINYPLVQYAIQSGQQRWEDDVTFSLSTNGTLLTEERIEWLVNNGVELSISIDGTQPFHDVHRVDAKGNGSYTKVRNALAYLHSNTFNQYPKVVLMMTLPSVSTLIPIAQAWHEDDVLQHYTPTHISGLTPNFSQGVEQEEWETLKTQYIRLLDAYEQHSEWSVLQTFFEEIVSYWKNRPVFEVSESTPLSTCMPVNTKLYIDANLQLAVCEKFNDRFRIGSINDGIDWQKANEMIKEYYRKRENRCAYCPAVRMCNMCLTSIAYTDDQWDTLCHNERLYNQLYMFIFCEMAERGMLTKSSVPTLQSEHCTLNEIEENDIAALRTIFSDADTQRYLPDLCDVANTDEGIKQILKSFRTYMSKNDGILWGIRNHGILIGFVATMDLSTNPTIFFAMNSKYRNRGYMKESVSLVTQYMCAAKFSNELHTEVDVNNIASQKVLEHCGYKVRGKQQVGYLYCYQNNNIELQTSFEYGYKDKSRKNDNCKADKTS